MEIKERKNIPGMYKVNRAEQLYKPVNLKTLACTCKGLWEGGTSHHNLGGVFLLACSCSFRAEMLQPQWQTLEPPQKTNCIYSQTGSRQQPYFRCLCCSSVMKCSCCQTVRSRHHSSVLLSQPSFLMLKSNQDSRGVKD